MVRKFQEADINEVAGIWLETNIAAHHFVPVQYWQGNFALVKEMLLQAQIYVYEEEASHRIQGFIGLDGDYIAGIFVCGAAQSSGIGKQLLDAAKEGASTLSLRVYQKNARAVKFYQREGFQICCEGVDEAVCEKEYMMAWKG